MGLRGVLWRENYVLNVETKRFIEYLNKEYDRCVLVGDMAWKLCYKASKINNKNIVLESTNRDEILNIIDKFVKSNEYKVDIEKGLNEDLITISVRYEKPNGKIIGYYVDLYDWTQFIVLVKYKDKINKNALRNINGVLTYDKKYLALIEFEEAVKCSVLNKLFCTAILLNKRVNKEKTDKIMKILNETGIKYHVDKNLSDETNPYSNTRIHKVFGLAIFLNIENNRENIEKLVKAFDDINIEYGIANFNK